MVDVTQNIDAYLSNLSDDNQALPQKIREYVQSINPQFEEAMVYGVPGFKYKNKSLCCYAAFKKHLGFYPLSPQVIKTFSKELIDFETAKSTVRFTPAYLIPPNLIKRMVLERASEIDNS